MIFAPENAEPLLGVTALESVGITVDLGNRTLKRLPAVSATPVTKFGPGAMIQLFASEP